MSRATKQQPHDPVRAPKHYTTHPSGIEPKAFAGDFGFFVGSAFKYLWRAGLKDGASSRHDLEKAIEYIRLEIERREARGIE